MDYSHRIETQAHYIAAIQRGRLDKANRLSDVLEGMARVEAIHRVAIAGEVNEAGKAKFCNEDARRAELAMRLECDEKYEDLKLMHKHVRRCIEILDINLELGRVKLKIRQREFDHAIAIAEPKAIVGVDFAAPGTSSQIGSIYNNTVCDYVPVGHCEPDDLAEDKE